jgi:hypothetical protein
VNTNYRSRYNFSYLVRHALRRQSAKAEGPVAVNRLTRPAFSAIAVVRCGKVWRGVVDRARKTASASSVSAFPKRERIALG